MPAFELTQRHASNGKQRRMLLSAPTFEVANKEANLMKDWVTTNIEFSTATTSKINTTPLKGKPLISLCRTMGAMIQAGLPIQDTLRFYSQGLADRKLAKTLLGVQQAISEGSSIADAFSSTGMFDELFINIIRAGVISGNLGVSFRKVADRIELELNFKKKLLGAILMPAIVIPGLFLVFLFSQIFFIPQIKKLLADVKAPPDPFSAIIFNISDFVIATWPIIIAIIIAVIVAYATIPILRSVTLELMMSKWRLLRNIVMGLRQMTIIGTMDMMISSDIPVIETLASVIRVTKGSPMEKDFIKVKEDYAVGINLREAIERNTSCDMAISHLLGVGEASGTLKEQTAMLSTMYDQIVSDSMVTFVAVAKYSTLVFSIIMFLFVVAGAYLPVMLMGPQMMSNAMH